MQVPEERDFSHSFEMTGREKRKRDFSLRRPTHSQERMRKKKSARSVRNDGAGAGDGHSKRKSKRTARNGCATEVKSLRARV
jgi:hypothetical protein